GGVTQAITAVLIGGVCVDRHRLDIERPIRHYAPSYPHEVSIRHALAHATDSRFRYDPAAFVGLTQVVEHQDCGGLPFRVAAAVEVLNRLGMARSVPGLDLQRPDSPAALLFDPDTVRRYQEILRQVATPYKIDRNAPPLRSAYPIYGFDASGGLVATARDLHEFEKALDHGVPLSSTTLRNQMWNPAIVNDALGNRITTPTGLGWFVQNASGEKLVWTFGHIPDASSALILKVPSKNLTLIMLSNSGGLANTFNFEQGDVTTSPFVKVFLRLFI
ncbi:MAG: serine hydrolase domain-containing protein, partial [Vicinamibacterales bacterium]